MASLNFCIRNFYSLRTNFLQNFQNVKKLKQLLIRPFSKHTATIHFNAAKNTREYTVESVMLLNNSRMFSILQYSNRSCMSRWSKYSQSGVFCNQSSKKRHRNKSVVFAENVKEKIKLAEKETRKKVHKKMDEIKENILTIPNGLCVLRIISTPILGYLVLSELYAASLGVFVFAGFTDLVDGYIARNFQNQQSMIGSFLDPAADKLLIATLFVTLTIQGLIPVPLTSLIIFRDACLMGAGFYIRYVSLPPPKTLTRYFDMSFVTARLSPTGISKANTMIQLSLVAASLSAPVFGFVDHLYLQILWYVTGTTTVLSAASYLYYKNSTYKLFTPAEEDKKK